ncbi:uncharacterized protein [Rutidosis leptorrhynchoides]|uniref:uncharacterized protein isoform X3 n=1 Tax=Rutidosis leptorrhynchoides TaxID=125765 RepID=UPI003A9A11CF
MAVEEINNKNNFSMAKSDHEIDQNHEPEPVAWGTWEELLLGYAVNRYGTKSWDSISTELKKRTSTTCSILFTPVHCEQKFDELKRRFNQSEDDNNNNKNNHTKSNDVVLDDDDTSAIPWLDELRKQRVIELERQLKDYDLYISSLQLKVKKLTEEGEKETELGHGNEGIEIRKDGETKDTSPENGSGEGSGDGESVSDRDNQSVNGSNGNVNAEIGIEKMESKPGRAAEVKGGPGEPDLSGNNGGPEKELKSEPDERTESMAESKSEGGKNSDVQSSASKENSNNNRVRRGSTVIKGGDEDQSTDSIPVRSLPLVDFLQKVHKIGSLVFECRLDRQEKLRYKNLIRQPIDYEILQTRLKEGWYSDGNDRFFRDLFLLVNNTRIFFPKDSPESVAAANIRQLILKEMLSKKKQKTDSKLSDKQTSSKTTNLSLKRSSEPANSLLMKPKLAGPIVVCRKRSSITAKAGGTSSGLDKRKEQYDLKNVDKSTEENRDITPKRSRDSFPIINKKKGKSGEKSETSDTKPDKKKKLTEAEEKKQSAAKFLNRMKRSSNEPLLNSLKEGGGGSEIDGKRGGNKGGSGSGGGGGGGGEVKKDQAGKKNSGGRQAKEQGSPAKRSVGRPPKRAAALSPMSGNLGKRNRESGDSETLGSKQTKKRSKR